MRVLMIGSGDHPSPFIERHIDALQYIGISVDKLSLKKPPQWRAYLDQLGFKQRIPRHVIDQIKKADILHYQWPSDWLVLHNLAQRFDKKAVLSLRGRQVNILPYVPGYEKYREKLKLLLPQCTGYHAVSSAILSEALQFGAVAERSRVIYTSVNTDFFTPQSIEPEPARIKIAMAGGLIWRKGYEYALLSLQQVIAQDKSVDLVIAGEGPDRDRIVFTLRDLGLIDHVTLAGKLDPIAVRNLLQACHIFLHTSLSEGIANSVIEAMACALPIVSTNCGGMAEAIQDGVEGFLVPTRDPIAAADALMKLIRDPVLRTEMGKAGRSRVMRQFTKQKQALNFKNFYEQLSSWN